MKEIINKIIWITHICIFLLISSLPTYAEFKFNDVEYRIRTNSGLNLEVIFKDITLSNNKKSSQFIIGFEGDTKKNVIRTIVLREYEHDFRIPKHVSWDDQPGRFYITEWSVKNGLFRRLFNSLTENDREKLIGACSYLSDRKIIDEMVKWLAKRYAMQREFLENPNVPNYIKFFTQLCSDEVNKIPVIEAQIALKGNGYDPGPLDGLFGKKTNRAMENYFSENGLSWDKKLQSDIFKQMRKTAVKVTNLSASFKSNQYFDIEGNLKVGSTLKRIPKKIFSKIPISDARLVRLSKNDLSKSKYIKGVSQEKFKIIEKIGDPLNCDKRINTLRNIGKGFFISRKNFLSDKSVIGRLLSEYRVVILGPGEYELENSLNLSNGMTLVGSRETVIRGDNTDVAVILNNASLSNVTIKNARKIGVSMERNSTIFNVIIKNSGIKAKYNEDGHGVKMVGNNSHKNCVVSVESSYGYNERGGTPIQSKGGNADGFSIKNGAYDVTLIDTHAHHNSDDGFDFWKAGHSAVMDIKIPTVRIFYSSAISNGKNPYTSNGDGSGFKFGSSDMRQPTQRDKGMRLIYGSVACNNKWTGFDRNVTRTKIISIANSGLGNGSNQEQVLSQFLWNKKDKNVLKCKMFQ